MKRKLAPWEQERKRLRKIEERLEKRKKKLLASETTSFGREIGRKRKRNRHLRDFATFSCPHCGNKLREDLIRLRQDLFECRKCKKPFIKENVIDEFDFDGLL